MLQRLHRQLNWKTITQPWQDVDWVLLLIPIALTVLGGLMIRSTELQTDSTNWIQHWITGGVGVALMMMLATFRYEVLTQWYWLIYAFTNLSLLAVRFFGTTALGAERWISIAGFHVQPSEFAKIGAIITLAAFLSNRPSLNLIDVTKALAIISLPLILVFLQPSLGTSLVFGAITLATLYWGNANPGWLILLISPIPAAILANVFLPGWFIWVILMGVVAWRSLPWMRMGAFMMVVLNLVAGSMGQVLWGLLHDYQKARITLFLDPYQDPLGGGYHLIQSRIAIGAGQLWGRGLHQGTQTQLHFIPEQHTDFIFAAIGEELGFAGAFLVLFVFWLLCLRLVLIAQTSKDNFGSLLAVGVLAMISFQTLVNISMTIGLAPITGIPLPWLSYGRSALLTNFIAIGLVASVANHRRRLKF
jgi:rod shape determining protein RodA